MSASPSGAAPPLPPYASPPRAVDDDDDDGFNEPAELGPDGLPLPVTASDVYAEMQMRRLIEAPIYPLLYPIGPNGDVRDGYLFKHVEHWGKDIGTCYLSGLVGGSIVGVGKGLVQSHQRGFGGWLRWNQMLNNASRIGGNTANTLGVFGFTYTIAAGLARKCTRVEGPQNHAYGAAAAATMQGMSRFGLFPGLACGVAVGCTSYQIMKQMFPFKRTIGFEA